MFYLARALLYTQHITATTQKILHPPVCLFSERAAAGTKLGGMEAPGIYRETDVGIHIGKLLYRLLFQYVSYVYL